MLEALRAWAGDLGRADLAGAATRLFDRQPPASELVVCHGDLHPFNVMIDKTKRIRLLDWSAALLAPRGYDVGFTSLMIANPPVALPAAARRPVAASGRQMAARFVRRYHKHSGIRIDPAEVAWHQAVVCLRTLVEVAQWVHEGVIEGRAGHPWLASGGAFAARLSSETGVPVRPR